MQKKAFFAEVHDFLQHRTEYLSAFKQREGKPLLGYFCSYTPLEIIYAAGALPVRILEETSDPSNADAFMPGFVCRFVRSALVQGLEGKLSYLDGLIHSYTCDSTCGLFHIWRRNLKPAFACLISLPYADSPEGRNYCRMELKKLLTSLEKFTGQVISETSLSEAIHIYNTLRQKVQAISKKRWAKSQSLNGSEFLKLCLYAQVAPPQQVTKNLTRISSVLKKASSLRIPLMVSGSPLYDPSILELIEELGAAIVADDLCTVTQAFDTMVEENRAPLEALILHFWRRYPCATRASFEERFPRLKALIEQSGAQGVLFLHQKFCDPYLADFPLMKKGLDALGIPSLALEVDRGVGGRERLRTRIQAFLEMVRGVT